jgi:hypothetical protein
MNIMDYPGLIILCIVILVVVAFRKGNTMKRRADYNRKIGEPDLAAPLPSEKYNAQRSSHRTIITVLVIIVVLILTFPLLRAIF